LSGQAIDTVDDGGVWDVVVLLLVVAGPAADDSLVSLLVSPPVPVVVDTGDVSNDVVVVAFVVPVLTTVTLDDRDHEPQNLIKNAKMFKKKKLQTLEFQLWFSFHYKIRKQK
jgi:hypothetical protein